MTYLNKLINKPIFTGDILNQKGMLTTLALSITLSFIFVLPWGKSIGDGFPAMLGALSFASAAALFITQGTHREYTVYHFLVIAFWAWALTSVIWSQGNGAEIEVAKTSFQVMLLPFLFTLVFNSKYRVRLAYQSYVLGNIVGSFIIISNYLNGIQTNYYNRYGIANMETDILGVALALSIPMAAYLSSSSKGKPARLLNVAAIPLIYFAIFLTGTRTASVIGLFGLAYWLFTYRKSSLVTKFSIVTTAIVFVAIVFSLAPKASIDRAFSTGKSVSSGTLNDRTTIWKSSISQWKSSPIKGVGLGGLGPALSREHVSYAGAHSVYVEVLTEMGLVGITLYLMIILSILISLLRTPLSEKVFLFSLLMTVLVSQIVQHTHFLKETWFALTIIVIHARFFHRPTS